MGRVLGSRRWLSTALLLLVAMTSLSSCGGGGGGDGAGGSAGGGAGGGTAGTLVFTPDKTSVSFDYASGQSPPSQIVTITATGQYTGTLYVSAAVSGPEIATPIQITVTNTTATVQIGVAPQVAPGTHAGTITLMACSDSACAHQVGNSPLTISYTVTVHGVLQVTPSSVALTAVSGQSASQVVNVQLPEGQSSFSTTVTSGSPWLTISPTSASSFTVVAGSLAAGVYTGEVTVTSGSSSATVNVTYTVTAQGAPQVTPSTVALTAVSGTSASELVSVQLPGGQSSFTTSVASGSPWLTISSSTASSFTLTAGPLAPGTYSGQVVVTAGSASVNVNVTYTVTAQLLAVTPSSVSLSQVSGKPASQAITVQLPTGQTSASESVTSGSPWLTITNATASSFTISAASLPSGSYSGLVQVVSGTELAMIVVNYTVSAPAGGDVPLAVSPASLALSTVEDATSAAVLTVTPPSWNPQVTITAEYPSGAASGWLTLSQVTGGESVVANAAGLTAGSYTANIRVHGAYPASDILVPVALTVGVGLVRPADVMLSINAETAAAALAGSVPVTVAAGPAVPFTASSNAPWLTLTTSSGQTGQSLAYTVNTSQLPVLTGAQVSAAQVTITPGVSSMTPVSFNVQVTGNLPQITTLAPYTQRAGQPARVILRGSGFSAISTPSARFTIDGQAPTSVSVVADTEAVAQFAALAAGAHKVSVSNALGLATGTGRVLATTVPAYSYAALPTGGFLSSITYDAERDALYGANTDAESIMSFRHTPASGVAEESWATASTQLAAAFDAGLTQDGTGLIASAGTSNPGTVELLDPATFTVLQSATNVNPIEAGSALSRFGIPTTNDGRSWLGVAESPTGGLFGVLAYVTPQSLTPTPFNLPTALGPSGLGVTIYDGPWYAMSRDGERLIVVPASSISPKQPMLYMDAANSQLMVNPAGLTFSYDFAVSETGDRAAFDDLTVRDAGFNLIGPATLPTSSPSYSSEKVLLSPDGSRLYVLTYAIDAGTTSGVTPRVFVFDTTTPQTTLPVLGYFDVADYPGCIVSTTGTNTCTKPNVVGTISLDGQTLFFAGNQKLLVVPVPATLSSVQAMAKVQRRATSTVAWPVNVH